MYYAFFSERDSCLQNEISHLLTNMSFQTHSNFVHVRKTNGNNFNILSSCVHALKVPRCTKLKEQVVSLSLLIERNKEILQEVNLGSLEIATGSMTIN